MKYPSFLLQACTIVFLTLFVAGCDFGEGENADVEISKTLETIYDKPDPYYDGSLDTSVYTGRLDALVRKSKRIEQMDRQRVREMKQPGEIPYQIEHDLFTSIHEGYTSYSIQNINVNEQEALALLEFNNARIGQRWQDSILLKYENGWKMDNVLYNDTNDLKKTLERFIQSYNTH